MTTTYKYKLMEHLLRVRWFGHRMVLYGKLCCLRCDAQWVSFFRDPRTTHEDRRLLQRLCISHWRDARHRQETIFFTASNKVAYAICRRCYKQSRAVVWMYGGLPPTLAAMNTHFWSSYGGLN